MVVAVRPPTRIELTAVGAVLRRHDASDVDAIHEAIEASRDHLRPFMPWADQARDATAQFLAAAVDQWDRGESFGYVLVDAADDGRVLGGAGLHRRSTPECLEIGYWRRADEPGRGLITSAAAALTAAAFDLPGITRVEIHCDVANTASAGVPRRLGFVLDGLVERTPQAPGETGQHQVWLTTTRPAPPP